MCVCSLIFTGMPGLSLFSFIYYFVSSGYKLKVYDVQQSKSKSLIIIIYVYIYDLFTISLLIFVNALYCVLRQVFFGQVLVNILMLAFCYNIFWIDLRFLYFSCFRWNEGAMKLKWQSVSFLKIYRFNVFWQNLFIIDGLMKTIVVFEILSVYLFAKLARKHRF